MTAFGQFQSLARGRNRPIPVCGDLQKPAKSCLLEPEEIDPERTLANVWLKGGF